MQNKFLSQYTGETWREAMWTPVAGLSFEVGKLAASMVDFLLASMVLFVIWKIFQRMKPATPTTEGNQ